MKVCHNFLHSTNLSRVLRYFISPIPSGFNVPRVVEVQWRCEWRDEKHFSGSFTLSLNIFYLLICQPPQYSNCIKYLRKIAGSDYTQSQSGTEINRERWSCCRIALRPALNEPSRLFHQSHVKSWELKNVSAYDDYTAMTGVSAKVVYFTIR